MKQFEKFSQDLDRQMAAPAGRKVGYLEETTNVAEELCGRLAAIEDRLRVLRDRVFGPEPSPAPHEAHEASSHAAAMLRAALRSAYQAVEEIERHVGRLEDL